MAVKKNDTKSPISEAGSISAAPLAINTSVNAGAANRAAAASTQPSFKSALPGRFTSETGAPKSDKPAIETPLAAPAKASAEDLQFQRFIQMTLMGANKSDVTPTEFDARFESPLKIGEQEFLSREEVAQGIDRLSGISDIARGKSHPSRSYNIDFGGFPARDFSAPNATGNWNKLSYSPVKVDKNFVLNGSFQQAFQIVLASEGGFANHRNDRGGATIYGVASNANPVEYQQIMAQLASGDKEGAMQTTMMVYKGKYWDKVQGIENMSPSARLVAFDAAINHGVGFTNKMVQATGADTDSMISYRSQKYAAIIQNDPSQAVFEKGWGNRLAKLDAITDTSEHNAVTVAAVKQQPSSKANYRTPEPTPA